MGSAFDQPNGQQAKKIEFKLSDAISTIFEGGPPHTSAAPAPPSGVEGFGTFAPPEEQNVPEGGEDSGEEMSERDDDEVISLQELTRNRMPEKGLQPPFFIFRTEWGGGELGEGSSGVEEGGG